MAVVVIIADISETKLRKVLATVWCQNYGTLLYYSTSTVQVS